MKIPSSEYYPKIKHNNNYQHWCIQDFPDRGVYPKGRCQPIILATFSPKRHEIEQIWTGARPSTQFVPQMISRGIRKVFFNHAP